MIVNMGSLEICMVMTYVITDCKCADLWSLMCLGDVTEIGPTTRQWHPTKGTGRWFPPFSCIMWMFWNNLFEDDILLRCDECLNNYEMLIELLMILSFWRIFNQLWNVNWVVDEWWTNYEM